MDQQFVDWFRSVAPYVHAFRGQTFVIAFPGEVVLSSSLQVLAHDVSLLHALGIRVVLVHGTRPQIEEQLKLRNLESIHVNGTRITSPEALECVKEAAGELRMDIEAAFSQGLPNTPMAHAQISVVSGNFVTSTPIGIIDGVDFQWTGKVRKIAESSIRPILDAGDLVLLSPLGYSPTGEAFNVRMEEVAVQAAVTMHASKLIFITDTGLVRDTDGEEIREITARDAKALIAEKGTSERETAYLDFAVQACLSGVERSHIVPVGKDGSILVELFTHDGCGTMVTYDDVELLREADISDVAAILKLIEPYEANGTLVKRGREVLEREIGRFSVLEHDGVIYGCAALYPFPAEKTAEMACLIVDPDVQDEGDGERILTHMENRARKIGCETLFILTTQTAHWFRRHGFENASVEDLPKDRQRMYNWQRKSRVLIKKLRKQ